MKSQALNLANEMRLRRARRVITDGSPPYRYAVQVVAALASVEFDVGTQFPDSRKYEPLDWIEIYNNDAVDLTITINGTIQYKVSAGTVRQINNQALWHVRVTNDDLLAVATVADEIILTMQREAMTADKRSRM